MKVFTKKVIDMATGAVLEEESYEYSGPVEECAESSTLVRQGTFSGEWTLTSTADADNAAVTITHGLTAQPHVVVLTPILSNFYLSTGVLTTLSATQIGVTKSATTTGSGNASAQCRVMAIVHHSIQQ